MIHRSTYTKEWIMKKSNEHNRGKRKADPTLIEKVTKAFHLLEELSKTNLEFVFKGGTSLLLLLDKTHRFSIDIDIVIEKQKDKDELRNILSQIIEKSNIFLYFEENERNDNKKVPKAHYKIFYKSALFERENYILLDVLFEKNNYADIISKDIKCSFIKHLEPAIKVDMPSIDCILGDKLSAFAPNTTGIPYGKNKELEIIKQLFDVGNLFDEMSDLGIVSKTFKQISKQELSYRKREDELTYENVLDDAFETSKIISERGRIEKDVYDQLLNGVKRINSHIISKNFIIESAVNSASKAAYLSQLIKKSIKDFGKFDRKIDLTKFVIENPSFYKFRTIMKFDPEAYFYWYKSIKLLN